ncbi:2-hydroxyacid dehydrogenase, partial [Chloroflexota bacterium]
MMAKPIVYITCEIPPEVLAMIGEVAEIGQWMEEVAIPTETLLEKVRDIDGLLCLLSEKVDVAIFGAARRLKVVSNVAVGYDNIDIAEATRRGIPVGNTPGVLSETTADFAFALLMAAARHIARGDRYVRNGQWLVPWEPKLLIGQDIHHSTLGIVGMGRIGSEVARRARGFNMKVLYHDAIRRQELEKELDMEHVSSLLELLSRSDFVSVHTPLSQETRKLIGAAEFSAMKTTAILINTSRGPVVDQKALCEALKSGQIASAAIDVAEVEPMPMDDPLLTLDNIVITPHIASSTDATRAKMAAKAAENLVAGVKGERLPHCVNPE